MAWQGTGHGKKSRKELKDILENKVTAGLCTISTTRSVATIQLITVAWMSVEVCISLFAGIHARSIALLGFGGDSVIELASALIVYARFQENSRIDEKTAARATGWLLFALAAFIAAASIVTLVRSELRPQPSYAGIVLLIAAAIVMPLLARRKRMLASETRSGALNADAVQSSMCAYMAWIALAGLLLNAIFHISWADPAAALLLLPIVIKEANEARRGKSCGCECG